MGKEYKINPMTEAWRFYVIEKLENWSLTFEGLENEEGESEGEEIEKLIIRFKENRCNKSDYEDICFHLWQISEGEAEE